MATETQVQELDSFKDLTDRLTNGLIVPGTGRIIYGLQSPDIKRIQGSYYGLDKDKKKVAIPLQAGNAFDREENRPSHRQRGVQGRQ